MWEYVHLFDRFINAKVSACIVVVLSYLGLHMQLERMFHAMNLAS